MKINWFPGHMTKALRMMASEVKNINCVIYVLDARAPLASLNPEFTNLVGEKPILYIFNKIDLADKNKLNEILPKFKSPTSKVLLLNATASGALKSVASAINELCNSELERGNKRGIKVVLRAMVLGVPNCGKSTLVNNLCGKAKALTGNKPGVTKGKQWVKIAPTLEILDTPGTLWPNLDDEHSAKLLAFIGSIKEEVLDKNELALELVKTLQKQYPLLLENRFKIDVNQTALEFIESVAKERKFLLKGGEIDYDRACIAILDDFKKGRLGALTLI